MRKWSRLVVLLVIIISCVACDQAAKTIAQERLAGQPPIVFGDNLIRFEYTENPAAFMSFGADFPPVLQYWIFTVLASVLLVGVFLYTLRHFRNSQLAIFVALAFFVGGGLGNLLDRLFNEGRVVDFVSIGIGPLRTGVFNLADMTIMTGFLMIILFGHRQTARQADEAEEVKETAE